MWMLTKRPSGVGRYRMNGGEPAQYHQHIDHLKAFIQAVMGVLLNPGCVVQN
ncbi:hypothetical protein QFZ80_004881 [Paenibacillus sp. V4I7]|nr:hypothetical protein [Paenibacillus sp. V4I7]MDQ0920443.1 hypothetical protein [Paenibacillus sp. V4I5]